MVQVPVGQASVLMFWTAVCTSVTVVVVPEVGCNEVLIALIALVRLLSNEVTRSRGWPLWMIGHGQDRPSEPRHARGPGALGAGAHMAGGPADFR